MKCPLRIDSSGHVTASVTGISPCRLLRHRCKWLRRNAVGFGGDRERICALDVAIQALQANEVTCALLDGGGDLLAGEPPPRQVGWKVGVAGVEGTPEEMGSMALARRAVATSGDLYQFVEIDGVRYSHLVDPRSGLGLTHRGSVSVIAADATTADALASAVSVLGPTRGLRLIESLADVEVQILVMEKKKVRVFRSTGFPAMEATADSGTE